MKLLLDQNISRKLLSPLQADFPGSDHVAQVGLETALDAEIWEYARMHDFAIVTQDSDFADRSTLYGHPPQVVWLRLGNVSTTHMLRMLEQETLSLQTFFAEGEKGCLVIR